MEVVGTDPRFKPIPPAWADVPQGFSVFPDHQDGRDLYVYRGRIGGNEYIISRIRLTTFDYESELEHIFLAVAVILLIAVAAAGSFLEIVILKPVRELTNMIEDRTKSHRYEGLGAHDAHGDEVGRLGAVVDGSFRRLYDALERERAFAGDVSHELATPLTTARMSLEMLGMSPLSPHQEKHVERAHRALLEMDELITSFLAFAGDAYEAELQATDTVSKIMGRMREIWSGPAKEKGLSLSFVTEARCEGAFSPVLLGTVASNIIKNAVLHTRSAAVVVTETATGFRVEDTGGGIAPEKREGLFDDFGKGEGRVNLSRDVGHGIGLHLVRRFADRCGWGFRFEDIPTPEGAVAGTRFVVELVRGETGSKEA